MTPPATERKKGLFNLHHRIYDWVLRWSGHRHAQGALFVLAVVEASCFPIPPDVLLLSIVLAKPKRAVRYALICTAGSVLGGCLGYAIGWGLWQALQEFCFTHLSFLGFTAANFAKVQTLYQQNAFLALFTAGFTPIPYKVFTIAAGVFGIGLPVFIAASILGRAGRFLLVALLVSFFGPKVEPFIKKYLGLLTLAFVILLVAGFWAIGQFGNH
jgi:membrane protein YqaA with SNARE-associated domain